MTSKASPERVDDLFREYARTNRRRIRNELVEAHIGFAHHVAGRYRNRGVADDDLRQIALLALVKSVERFDPDHGAAFTSFAGRTIEGEIKRHFRDATWSVRVPRSAKELHLLVRNATTELSQKLARSPTVDEMAEHLDLSRDDVVRALAASAAFSSQSLDAPARGNDSDGRSRYAVMTERDEELDSTPERLLVESLIGGLAEREAEIIRLRFFEGLTQSEIAERVGVSQMHVSRLLRRSLATMRARAGDSAP